MSGKRPLVTGISPNDGFPGTQITIRGENLGVDQEDLKGLLICGTSCVMSARWESSRKIVARVGHAKGGVGDIVVLTKSGGRGESTVMFRVFHCQIGPLQDSAVWIDESRSVPGRVVAGATTTAIIDEDPLGISDERDERKGMEPALPELYPDGSGNIRLENFEPVWYLLENYKNASLSDLKGGLDYMGRQMKTLQSRPQDLLRNNLHSFLSCVDALASLNSKLEEEKTAKGWPLTKNLDEQIHECQSTANELFAAVLGRKDRADSTRSALSVIQRFKPLFFLPQNIKKNLAKNDYSAVWNDYTRTKAMFGNSDAALFKEAFVEVEKQIDVFKETLKHRLLEFPSTLDEQKVIIRFLLLLEPDSDPGADCLEAHGRWLQELLWDLQKKFVSQAQTRHKSVVEEDYDHEDKLVTDLGHNYLFVENTVQVLASRLHSFWKLGRAYIDGIAGSKPNLHREEEIEMMIGSVVNQATYLIINAVLPKTLSDDIREKYNDKFSEWPPQPQNDPRHTQHLMITLRQVRSLIGTLLQQDLRPCQLVALVQLTTTLRIICLKQIIENSITNVINLQSKETWKIQTQEAEFAKTSLPDLFETEISDSLPYIQQTLSFQNFKGELDLWEDKDFPAILQKYFTRLVSSFKDMLERFAKEWMNFRAARVGGPTVMQGRPGELNLNQEDGGGRKSSSVGPVKDKKLLVASANCDYVLRFSLEPLVLKLRSSGVRSTDRIMEDSRKAYMALRKILLTAYTNAKCAPFVELLEPVHYDSIPEIIGVSNYVKDLILCVVTVHAELFLVAPHFTSRVMSFVVASCTQQLTDHINTLQPQSNMACTQVVADLMAFEESVASYLSDATAQTIRSVRSPFTNRADKTMVEKVLDRYRNRMRLTLLSLHESSNDVADV